MKTLFTSLFRHPFVKAATLSVSISLLPNIAQAQTPIVVDDDDSTGVTYTGTWTRSTNDSAHRYGASFRTDGATGRGTKQVQFTPNLPSAGIYRVEAWWRGDDSCDNQVPFIVKSSEGTYSTTVNQRFNGAGWRVLTQRQFASGSNPTTGSVTINNTGTTNGAVNVDAVRWVPITGTEIVVDNDDTSGVSTTGTWTRVHNENGIYSSSFLSDGDAGKGTKSVQFVPTLPVAGIYSVYGWWNAKTNRANNTKVDVYSLDSLDDVGEQLSVNQRTNGEQWNLLATRRFEAGTNASYGKVVIRNTDTNGVVSADAVRWVLISPAPTAITLTAAPGNGHITLNWTGGDGAITYWVSRSTDTISYSRIGAVSAGNPKTYTDNVTNGITYYYQIESVNAAGTTLSNIVSAAGTSSLLRASNPSQPRS